MTHKAPSISEKRSIGWLSWVGCRGNDVLLPCPAGHPPLLLRSRAPFVSRKGEGDLEDLV